MKNSDVHIGTTYLVKVARNLVPVKITREHPSGGGGWEGVSAKTGKTIRIKSAQRLRKRLADAAHGVAKGAANVEKPTKDAKAEPRRDTGEPPGSCCRDRGQTHANAATSGGPMSLLDAAAHLLSLGTGDVPGLEPGPGSGAMRCKDIVDLAIARGLWTPRDGKTPASTLHAAISREIKTRGDASRFAKAERGKFSSAS
jgi:hypothetical protein